MYGTDSRRPAVRKRQSWGVMEVEKRGETKRKGREGGIKAFSLVSIHSVRPHRRRDGKMKQAKQQAANVASQTKIPSLPPSMHLTLQFSFSDAEV